MGCRSARPGVGHRGRRLGAQYVDRPVPNIYREPMNVDLTPDQRALVKRAIDSGRFSHEEEAVQEALALWEERERRRLEILASLDEAEASLARGDGRPITEESMKALAEDVKQRGRTRLAAERNASH
jgi:putative addiction module CopG family antidote